MTYIIHCLMFVLNNTEHTYFFQREDFSNGILSTDTFDSISQHISDLTKTPPHTISKYISDLTGTPTPTPILNQELDVNTVMLGLNSYGLSISYGLATNFTNSITGWSNKPYTDPTNKEEENG